MIRAFGEGVMWREEDRGDEERKEIWRRSGIEREGERGKGG